MSGLSSTSTKANSKSSKDLDHEAKQASAIKGSTEGSVSGPQSVNEVQQHQSQSSDQKGESSQDSSSQHRFNLRDRKKIHYNKKYGGFTYANQNGEGEDHGDALDEDDEEMLVNGKRGSLNLGSDDEDFNIKKEQKKTKKRDLKRRYKKANKKSKISHNPNAKPPRRNANRTMLDGCSIFELIMPWKDLSKYKTVEQPKEKPAKQSTQPSLASFLSKSQTKVQKVDTEVPQKGLSKKSEGDDLIQKGLALTVKPKESIVKTNFDNHAKNVEAILINPPWNTQAKDKKGKQAKGITIEDFGHLNFSKNLMIDGLVFVWVEKEIISPVIKVLEKQDLIYVENVCWVMLDETKRQAVDESKKIDVSPAYLREDYQYVKKSHKTLLIFRRLQKKSQNPLELRHQRTCDVCFDFKEHDIANYKPNEYIYKLIETLLPKSMVDEQKKHLRMIELWAHDPTPRKGWIKYIE